MTEGKVELGKTGILSDRGRQDNTNSETALSINKSTKVMSFTKEYYMAHAVASVRSHQPFQSTGQGSL